MSEQPPTPVNALRYVPLQPANDEMRERPQPLQVTYSTTRVLPQVGMHLQRMEGVVRRDRLPLAESFRMLRNQLLLRMRADGHNVLGVTSPRAIGGKSLTALNLALTIAADFDTTVLLVDADLGAQGLQALLHLQQEPGLSDHLTQGLPMAGLLINPGIDRFVFLPAGGAAGMNSAELLGTRTTSQLVAELRERYPDRYVIVDLPPVLDTADTLAFMPQVQTALVVVEEHTTTVPDIEATSELLAPFNVIGTVISHPREPVVEPPTAAPFERPRPWYQRWLRRKG